MGTAITTFGTSEMRAAPHIHSMRLTGHLGAGLYDRLSHEYVVVYSMPVRAWLGAMQW
jgi:hypothetical protein